MDESIQMYLKEISQFPLLTFGEEVEAAKTGDTENPVLFIVMIIISLMGMIGIILIKRRGLKL